MRLLVNLAPALAAVVWSASDWAAESRNLEFTYEILAAEFPSTEAVDIYIPLPREHSGQACPPAS